MSDDGKPAKGEMVPEKKGNVDKIEEMAVGCYYQDKRIKHVYVKSEKYIIFLCDGSNSVRYRYTDGRAFSEPISQLESLTALAHRKFKGERRDILNPMIITAARRIFQNVDGVDVHSILLDLKNEIERLPEVSVVIGRERNFCVWQNSNGEISYWCNKTENSKLAGSIAEFTRLKALAGALLPGKNHHKFNLRLGSALYASLKLGGDVEKFNYFSSLEKFILDASQNEVKLKILVITAGVAIFLMVISIFGYYFFELPVFIKMSAISATGGIAGALISFLERSKNSSIGDGDLAPFAILSSVSRVIIGGLFGAIAYSVANADLAFSLFKSSKPALLILGIAAGFSERLIPDVLSSISSSNQQSKLEKIVEDDLTVQIKSE